MKENQRSQDSPPPALKILFDYTDTKSFRMSGSKELNPQILRHEAIASTMVTSMTTILPNKHVIGCQSKALNFPLNNMGRDKTHQDFTTKVLE